MTISIAPPDGYDDIEYVIVVNKEQLMGHTSPEYCVAVILVRPESQLVEEVGCGGGIGTLLALAAGVIRDSTDLNATIARHPAGKKLAASLSRGLAQSAAGEVVDLGDYPYLATVPYRGSPIVGLTGDNEDQP